MLVIAGFAVCFRVVMLLGPNILDDDIYRYHWDGVVLAHGISPYAYAPNDPALEGLRDEAWEHVSYPYVKTIYPPLSQALAAGGYLVWESPFRIRLIATIFDLLTLVPIVLILRWLKLPTALCIIYAWNPLPIKEFASSGHLDSVAIFLVTFALYALLSRRAALSAFLWGLSFLAKPWTLLLAPLYLVARASSPWRAKLLPLTVFVVTVAVGFAPFAGSAGGLLEGMRTFSGNWEFNSGMFAIDKLILGLVLPNADPVVRAVYALAWLLLAVWVARTRVEDDSALLRQAGLLMGAALVLSPVCNPWYVCWLLPILCVHRSPAWLGFTGLVMLSYIFYVEPQGHLDPAARFVEYAVFGGLLVWEAVRGHPQSLLLALRR